MILLLGAVAFAPTLKVGFLYDDHFLIESNPTIRSWSWAHIRHDFTTGFFNDPHGTDFYRPTMALTHRVEYSLWGLHPFGYHLTNLLLHLGNALLVTQLILVLGLGAPVALVTGCLFAVHPLVIEQMLIVTGRPELLAFLFSLATVLFLLQESWPGMGLGIVSCALALLSKESAAITPAFLALALYFRRAPVRQYAKLLPLLILIPLYGWWRSKVVGVFVPAIPVKLMLSFFCKAFSKTIFSYAGLILVPWNLHTERPFPPLGPFWLIYTVLLTGLVGWLLYRRSRLGIFCLAWFAIALLPKTAVMLTHSILSDHWVYPGLLGLLLPIGVMLTRGWKTNPRLRTLCGTLFLIMVIGWITCAYSNVERRGTDEKLYRDALAYNPAPAMRYNLGLLLLRQGRVAEAIPYFDSLVHEFPDEAGPFNALAWAYASSGRRADAEELLEKFLRTHPQDPQTRDSLQRLRSPRQ